MIALGETNIEGLYLGNTKINKAYLGDTLVYGNFTVTVIVKSTNIPTGGEIKISLGEYSKTVIPSSSETPVFFSNVQSGVYTLKSTSDWYSSTSQTITVNNDLQIYFPITPTKYTEYLLTVISNSAHDSSTGTAYRTTVTVTYGGTKDVWYIDNGDETSRQYYVPYGQYITVVAASYLGNNSGNTVAAGSNKYIYIPCRISDKS